MKIAYNGFWGNFNVNNNWFNFMFREYYNNETIEFSDDLENADIVLSTVFGPRLYENNKAIRLFYSGESYLRGMESDEILLAGPNDFKPEKGYFRLPHWMININFWPNKFAPFNHPGEVFTSIEVVKDFCRPATENEIKGRLNRNKFCAVFSGNFSADLRKDVANVLEDIAPVDKYGCAFNNQYNGDKIKKLKEYRFNLCFENTICNGYVTEKLPQAKFAGCIPLYWGDKASAQDFNPKCFLNWADYNSLNDFIEEIEIINSSEETMSQLFAEPLFNEMPTLEPLYVFFDKVGMK
jgi:hypothetical protein